MEGARGVAWKCHRDSSASVASSSSSREPAESLGELAGCATRPGVGGRGLGGGGLKPTTTAGWRPRRETRPLCASFEAARLPATPSLTERAAAAAALEAATALPRRPKASWRTTDVRRSFRRGAASSSGCAGEPLEDEQTEVGRTRRRLTRIRRLLRLLSATAGAALAGRATATSEAGTIGANVTASVRDLSRRALRDAAARDAEDRSTTLASTIGLSSAWADL
mmetsp:Transcript_28241/g.61675  ORF Transcript_28241/g.61675 Transcript_28241/m.61675 type:complete len:224 (-) Transcript_28241:677-1348(-)